MCLAKTLTPLGLIPPSIKLRVWIRCSLISVICLLPLSFLASASVFIFVFPGNAQGHWIVCLCVIVPRYSASCSMYRGMIHTIVTSKGLPPTDLFCMCRVSLSSSDQPVAPFLPLSSIPCKLLTVLMNSGVCDGFGMMSSYEGNSLASL